ncbi:30S ribosomal protein S5 [Methanoplanus sp. FWC-SCC4]|uniref:Small ribosomal subunit protein uS5 n=1 Tax=Methanochimaera problematica TaxID=2609417 RepID=A0AA97FC33_9EURY|nr:30S ribosomal protein S5 [Methanoplanus sp. FWC-SCC4]WOF15498.1 30S ribosomal protein S5 [Methanoplanus sp. FWC-SCC4]
MAFEQEEWIPLTGLGKKVAAGEIPSLDTVLESGRPIKEPQIVDYFLPDLEDEVLDINMVQRMTDSGRRVKFRCAVVVGNSNGYIGFGQAKDAQVGNAIKKAIANAKINIIKVKRGCGSWECACGEGHSIPVRATGKAGSVKVTLVPAPQGIGLVTGDIGKKVLHLAGIRDVWTYSSGNTRTTINYAKATYDALKQANLVRMGGSQ